MRKKLKLRLQEITEEFEISNMRLENISDSFFRDMTYKKELKMLPTYVKVGDSFINDEYLAIDLGGSNIRISKFKVADGIFVLDKKIRIPLKTKLHDYTTNKYSLKSLFVMCFKKMKKYLNKNKLYNLGITISFELESKAKDKARIIDFSKGFNLSDTIGEDIIKIAKEAIDSVGLKIIPVAVINDVAATMVTGRFYNPNASVSLIVGTGHNSCFISENKEIINVESGNFKVDIPLTNYDKGYLFKNPKDKDRILEIMTGGKYIGEVAKEIFKFLENENHIKQVSNKVTTKFLINMMNKKISLKYNEAELETIKTVAKILFRRSARLIVSEILAIIKYIDNDLSEKHTVIFDGSVYENCSYFRNEISEQLSSRLGEINTNISHKLIKDASGIGAIIVASKKDL